MNKFAKIASLGLAALLVMVSPALAQDGGGAATLAVMIIGMEKL